MNDTPDYRNPDAIRDFVMDHMHYSGDFRHFLSEREWSAVYLCGDGFGTVDADFASTKLEWDWSHVRDSTDEAFLDMAATIQTILRRKAA